MGTRTGEIVSASGAQRVGESILNGYTGIERSLGFAKLENTEAGQAIKAAAEHYRKWWDDWRSDFTTYLPAPARPELEREVTRYAAAYSAATKLLDGKRPKAAAPDDVKEATRLLDPETRAALGGAGDAIKLLVGAYIVIKLLDVVGSRRAGA